MDRVHLEQLLVFDLVVVAAPAAPAAAARIPTFLDVNERHLEREILVWEDMGEVDEFVEHVNDTTPFRTQTSPENFASSRLLLDQAFLTNYRFHDQDAMVVKQVGDFPSDRGKRAVLDLDQLTVADHVNPIVAQRRLNTGVSTSIEMLELSV